MPSEDEDRREFLKTCGKFAAVTPPAMTMLLSTSLMSNALCALWRWRRPRSRASPSRPRLAPKAFPDEEAALEAALVLCQRLSRFFCIAPM